MSIRSLLCAASLLVLPGLLSACREATPPGVARPSAPSFVGRAVCADCHEQESVAWRGSDHDLAMQSARPETVLGDFDNVTFTHLGDTIHFFHQGDAFFVSAIGPAGRRDTFPVRYTFGYRPLQQYLVPFTDGRLQALTVAWDTERQRWFSLYPDEQIPHRDWLHWTGGGMNWNHMCADCHSTNLQKNYDLGSDTYHTTFSEIDVSCEACHGPASAHVEWARTHENEIATGKRDPYVGEVNLTVNLTLQQAQIKTCATCHSRRRTIAPDFTPGEEYLDHYAPELLEEDLYFPDGQIKDEVFVYASFRQSEMYRQGVRCSDCHDPHSTRLKLEGNALCNQCHATPFYDTPEHHFHEPDTEGAQCVNCHMPERTYMVVDPRRDHSFKVPRPDLTVDLEVPNACNGCHTNKSAEWARDYVVEWYGPERPVTEFARTFAAGREQQSGADTNLAGLVAATDSTAAIVRATATELIGSYSTPIALSTTRDALVDPAPLVRAAAVRALEGQVAPSALVDLVTPLLRDSVRLVRIEAARAVALAEQQGRSVQPPRSAQADFREALEEYVESQRVNADQPGSHLNLAVMHEQHGTLQEAEQAYRTALRVDSTFVPAHLNLAMLYNDLRTQARQARRAEEVARLQRKAEASLRAALRHQTELADAHYMLGLLLAEQRDRLEEATVHLARAASLSPEAPRIQYNAGLAYQHLEQHEEAERLLLAAHRLAPEQPDFLNALSVFYMQRERWDEAYRYTQELADLVPQTSAIEQRLEFIRRRADR